MGNFYYPDKKMGYGKHAHLAYKDVPEAYLRWVVYKAFRKKDGSRTANRPVWAQQELDRRQKTAVGLET